MSRGREFSERTLNKAQLNLEVTMSTGKVRGESRFSFYFSAMQYPLWKQSLFSVLEEPQPSANYICYSKIKFLQIYFRILFFVCLDF